MTQIPQGRWGAGALKSHSLFFYYGIYNAFEVDAFGPYNFGSKGLQGFMSKTRSRMVLWEVLDL